MKKWSGKVFLLIMAVLLLPGLSFSGCSKKEETSEQQKQEETASDQEQTEKAEEAEENLFNTNPGSIKTELEESDDLAWAKAKEWQKDINLTAVQIEIPASLKKAGTSRRYFFSSANDDKYYWTIALTSGNLDYIRALIPKEDYISGGLKSINSKYCNYNYLEALGVAEENGGKEWRSSHNLGGITMILRRSQPKDWHYWQIKYSAIDETGEQKPVDDFRIKFSSENGDIVEE